MKKNHSLQTLSFQFELVLLVALMLSFAWSMLSGAVVLPWSALVDAWQAPESADGIILWELRLPRAILAALVGAALAGAGGLAQGLFRNPLADPGLLGVSSGAAVGAALVIVLGAAGSGWAINIGACLGAALCTWCVYRVGRTRWGLHVTRMLLVGVAVNALVSAVLAFLSYVADDHQLRNLMFWLLGSFNGAGWKAVSMTGLALLLLIVLCQRFATPLNVLALGESEARHLGINVERLQQGVIVAVAVAVGISVAAVGTISFVGLVVPHAVRILLGPDHRRLLPACMLLGALVMVLADLAARMMLSPAELPIGVFTALVGAPFFVILVVRMGRSTW